MSAAGLSAEPDQTVLPVQYLRAAAAFAVVLFHISVLSQETWGLDPARVDHVGAAGVDLFFVISGFIMAMIVDRSGAFDGRQFLIRRVARVVPAYWAITLFVFILALAMPSLFRSTEASLGHLLVSLAFLPIDVGSGSTGPLLIVGWTLNYEMFFYALVALTVGLFGDRRLIGTAAVLLGLVATGLATAPGHATAEFYTDPILLEFVFGILIFRSWRRRRIEAGLGAAAAFLVGLTLLALQWERPLDEWRAFYWGVPAAAVLYGGLGALRFSSRILALLGDWSYALYLTHVFVVTFYIRFAISSDYGPEASWPVHYLIMLAGCVGLAAMFYYCVERPLSRWTLGQLQRRLVAPAESSAIGAERAG